MSKLEIVNADCFDWASQRKSNTIHAICTDPPYGLIEFSKNQIEKMRSGNGGVWRLPPVMNGCKRAPLPRFTILSNAERTAIQHYFENWGKLVYSILVPGAHVFIAGNSQLVTHVQQGMLVAGYEIRGTIVRAYQGFRGGDRPKNAEKEFNSVCVSLKGCYEPWLLFRKPISEKTVAQNLRKWGTGGLRMLDGNKPVPEMIMSARTPRIEKEIASHPCLKPQHLMRILVRSALPLGEGIVLDTFAGAASTLAAAESIGYSSIGLEIDKEYYDMALSAIPRLAKLYPDFLGGAVEMPAINNRKSVPEQMLLFANEHQARYGK
jgi:site-specific DNA-methyltransferase (adenine-specific)